MNSYEIFSVEGRTLRFRGDLIATVKSGTIETTRGGVWFELNAYDREPNHFVITISAKGSGSEIDEVFEFYNMANVTAAEDFLYDFDPSVILPSNILTETGSKRNSALVITDHAYYSAARLLVRKLHDHDLTKQPTLNQQNGRLEVAVPRQHETGPDICLASRIKQVLWRH